MSSYEKLGTEVYQCYSVNWTKVKLPSVGETRSSLVKIENIPEEFGEINLLRLDDHKLCIYLLTANLHKLGLIVKRSQCVIQCNWKHPFDINDRHTTHNCPEVLLESIDKIENKSIQIFTGGVSLNIPEEKKDLFITVSFKIEIGSDLEHFRSVLIDRRFEQDLRNAFKTQTDRSSAVRCVTKGHVELAPKFVLESRSNVLAELLAWTSTCQIELNVSIGNLKNFLHFLCTGQLLAPANEELMTLADKYNVTSLLTLCKAAKEVDGKMELSRLSSINDELMLYAARSRKLLKKNSEDYSAHLDVGQRVGYIQPFTKSLLAWSPGKNKQKEILEVKPNSSLESCEYSTVLRHCSPITFLDERPYKRWGFEDRSKIFSFLATIYKNENPDSHFNISLLTVLRGNTFKIVKVLYMIHAEPYQRGLRPKTQIGELAEFEEHSEIRVWKGKAYKWESPSISQERFPLIEFFIYVKEVVPSYGFLIVDGLMLNHYAAYYKANKGADVKLTVGDKVFQAHRTVLAARSSVLAKIINEQLVDDENQILNLPTDLANMNAETFEVVLEFLYTGQLIKPPFDINIRNAAEKLNITTLLELYEKSREAPFDCEFLLKQVEWD